MDWIMDVPVLREVIRAIGLRPPEQHGEVARRWAKVRSSLRATILFAQATSRAAELAEKDAAIARAKAGQAALNLKRTSNAAASKEEVERARKEAARTFHLAKALGSVAQKAAAAAKGAVAKVTSAVSTAALRANPGVALGLVDSNLQSIAPAIRVAIGDWLIRNHDEGGRELGELLTLRVLRPQFEEQRRLDPSAPATDAADILPVFSVRLHKAGRAPPFEDLFRHQSDGLGVLPNSNVGVVGASADGGEGESTWPMEAEWPEEWSTPSEREHVLAVDFDITVAVRTNWELDPVYFGLEGRKSWMPGQLAQFAVKAFVLQARARVWFHLQKRHLKLALHGGELGRFRSVAELGLCGCCGCGAVADRFGLTSRLMRHYLQQRLTAKSPLEIELPQGVKGQGGTDGELRWTSSLTGISHSLPLRCKQA